MASPPRLENMKDVQKALNALLLPTLAASGWEGKSIAKLHKSADGLDVWTTLFGWPRGDGPTGALSVDVGVVPPLATWNGKRDEALRLLCNGWDPAGLTYHVPTCWHRRFPEEPLTYQGATAEALAKQLEKVMRDIERWAKKRSTEELSALATELSALKGPGHAGSRQWARNYRKVLGE